ncbi:MAG: sulfite exporter TauE/SafE family protein [Clostridia bacterium]|nr:sulfite exporter TauE/SafE family protein [Clostridia bacterium]
MNFQLIIFSFLAAVLGSMGFGGGAILIIYLTAIENFPQLKAQGINLIFFIPCALFAALIYSKQKLIEKKFLPWLIIFGAVGVLLGLWIIDFIDTSLLSKLFGSFLVIIGLKGIFKKKK